MRVKTIQSLLAVAGSAVILAAGAPVRAGSILTLSTGGNQSVSVSPGQSFTLDIGLTPDMSVNGFSLYLQAIATGNLHNADPGFQVTEDTSLQTAISDPLTIQNSTGETNPVSFSPAIPIPLSPSKSADLGFAAQDTTKDSLSASSSSYPLLELTVEAPLTPGTYSLDLIDTAIVNAAGSEEDQNLSSGASTGNVQTSPFSVAVVPEPATLALFMLGGLGLLLRKCEPARGKH